VFYLQSIQINGWKGRKKERKKRETAWKGSNGIRNLKKKDETGACFACTVP
jgi:hypothetical protein